MWQVKVNAPLYRCRYLAVLSTFLFLLYCNGYMWLFTPLAGFGYRWFPDSQLQVKGFDEDVTSTFLQDNDVILAVNGQPVRPGQAVYPLPKQQTYSLTVRRGDELLNGEVVFPTRPGPMAVNFRLPAGLLSLILWVVGPLSLHFARRENLQAIHLGYIFLLGGVIVVAIQGLVLGVPGAWIGGTPLIFLGAASLVYMGFIPRSGSLPRSVQTTLAGLYALAALLGIAALLEGLFLFPQGTSFHALIGVSSYRLGLFFHFSGLLACFTILLWRAVRMPSSYQRQQVNILLFFVGLSTLPAALLTFIPEILFDTLFLPIPVSISLLVLFPLGYFYVIFRKGYLGLDVIFSRLAVFIALTVATVAFYGTFLFVLQSQFKSESSAIVVATLAFVPMLVITRHLDSPLDTAIQRVLFGRQAVQSDERLPSIAAQLSSKPELTTLKAIVKSLSDDFHVPKALLVLKDLNGWLVPAAQIGVSDWQPRPMAELTHFTEPVVRTAVRREAQAHYLLEQYPWVEMIVPIILRGEQIGVLALARPADGYFNVRHVQFLARAADMIAIGSEAIFLFEAARQLSLQLLSAQEAERKRLASQIHDDPLQVLVFINNELRHIARNVVEREPEIGQRLMVQSESLQSTIARLRDFCTGLYPPVIGQGFEMIAQQLAYDFTDQFGLNVELNLQIPDNVTDALDIDVATAVYYILREALNNVVKHARIDRACVEMIHAGDRFILIVADEGVGSQLPSMSRTDLFRGRNLGVVNMFERAELVGGALLIEHNWPQGTKIVFEVPLDKVGE